MGDAMSRKNKIRKDINSDLNFLYSIAKLQAVRELRDMKLSDRMLIGKASLEYFKSCVAVPFFINALLEGKVEEKWFRLFTTPEVAGEHILAACRNAVIAGGDELASTRLREADPQSSGTGTPHPDRCPPPPPEQAADQPVGARALNIPELPDNNKKTTKRKSLINNFPAVKNGGRFRGSK